MDAAAHFRGEAGSFSNSLIISSSATFPRASGDCLGRSLVGFRLRFGDPLL